ncbi:tryptophan synthase subunit alpha [Deinococcus cellulosilyticus]|uniref:Tryptophan synthase alpha chain n=1 Tax=Deinococcus cellulosilyticus (strain DSM 18568 / NBRC 106333 / KACC 11606 / 5516J-15) TaxID=1223518 RepID=A0A511MZW2_DEIC1|nr:tryptophan synthase subunit alpha [Deinococcus cellulosilyticus]GEM46089.1 tryptophan synthase alpha chain [Deinococcus cellulosilyticus NBRC 106333 = KACC 11606]
MSRIQQAFDNARKSGRAAFIPYLPAGYPSKAQFVKDALALLEQADLMEIGLPYSDPLGDGPTIQRATEKVLRQGFTMLDFFDAIREVRKQTDKALLVMTYYNPILAWGEEAFIRDVKEAGIDGLILPDLPPDEADTLIPLAEKYDVKLTFLIAPTSTPNRVELVARSCTGFVYAVSVVGVTGARSGEALYEVPDLVKLAKQHTGLPVAVGFGVSDRASAAKIASVADGVVVGSAFINTIEKGGDLTGLARNIFDGTYKAS